MIGMDKNKNTDRLIVDVSDNSKTATRSSALISGNAELMAAIKMYAKEVGVPLSRIFDRMVWDYLEEYDPTNSVLDDGWVRGEIIRTHDRKIDKIQGAK